MYYEKDWLLSKSQESFYEAFITESAEDICISNNIISRRFIFKPDFSSVSLFNSFSKEEFIRAIKPEAVLIIDGNEYNVGGVLGQTEFAFLKTDYLKSFCRNEEGFNYLSHKIININRDIKWNKSRRNRVEIWPPKGKCMQVLFTSRNPLLKDISVTVCYEIYDGIPVVGKYFIIENKSGRAIRLNSFKNEIIALTEHSGTTSEYYRNGLIDEARNIFTYSDIENTITPTCHFKVDPDYTSQVDYLSKYPILFVSSPPVGPFEKIENGNTFKSYTTFVMLYDNPDRNRRALTIGRFFEVLAPWCTENPIFVHIISSEEKDIKNAVDQCVETGFEMIIMSFGSGLNMENITPEYISKIKRMTDYAHSKGIQIGGYSLLASRNIDEKTNVISNNVIFDFSPCLCSKWGIDYMNNIKTFIEKTEFDVLEHDGSYPGDTCSSVEHIGHEDYEDSQYKQLMSICDLYRWCREKGVYLNVPDLYFLAGNNKSAMGYKEVNWSLPRESQVVIARQNIYDGTWKKLPSMGWMFVPLMEYHGGGKRATVEPLCEHLDHYSAMMSENMLAGVQAAYRGKRLYDTEETKNMVKETVSLYKKYRDILESQIIHIRRPDGRSYDGYMHVNSNLSECGFLVFFNPDNNVICKEITIPLYYTGLTEKASVSLFDKQPSEYSLDRSYNIKLKVNIPQNGYVWYVIRNI